MAQKLARRKPERFDRSLPAGARWPQIEATTLADRVYQIVRYRIVHRELAPGTFVREQELSRATGVSRTPVREALNRLASQDFLERVPHRGFRVPDRPWEMLLEVYPIVAALEVLAMNQTVEHFLAEDLAILRDINLRLQEAGSAGDAKAQADANHAFHKAIYDRSGNARLAELLDQLRIQVMPLDVWYFSIPGNVDYSVAEHDSIITALDRHDFSEARESLRHNYMRGRKVLEEEIRRKNGRVISGNGGG